MLYPALSPYVYVADNPLTAVDPTGKDSVNTRPSTGQNTQSKPEDKKDDGKKESETDKEKVAKAAAATETGVEAQNMVLEWGKKLASNLEGLGEAGEITLKVGTVTGKLLGLIPAAIAWGEAAEHPTTGNKIEAVVKTLLIAGGPEVGVASGILDVTSTTHDVCQSLGTFIDVTAANLKADVAVAIRNLQNVGLQRP